MVEFCDVLDIILDNQHSKYSTVCGALTSILGPCLGKGSYGTVWALNSKQVLKVYKSGDLAYFSFLSLIKHNPSVHFPEIYDEDHFKKFRYVVLERVDEYAPLWGCPDAHVSSLRDGFRERLYGPGQASVSHSDTVHKALDLIAPLGLVFGLDIWKRNLGIRDGTLIFLDPVTNSRTSHEDFEERLYCPKVA